ncbi:MAG: DsbE family thiol:disulfide interchange protein [Beijerinckiaceae bacterium]
MSEAIAKPRGVNWVVAAPLIVFVLLAGLFLLRLFAGDPQKLPSAMIGKPAPAFTLPALAGLRSDGAAVPGFDDKALASGRPSLVNVFASWCVPCHQEHPILMEMAKVGGVDLYGINYKDEADNARRFLGAKGNPYKAVGVDKNGRASIEWGVYGVPETFVVDGSGKIIHKHVGPLSAESAARILAMVKK